MSFACSTKIFCKPHHAFSNCCRPVAAAKSQLNHHRPPNLDPRSLRKMSAYLHRSDRMRRVVVQILAGLGLITLHLGLQKPLQVLGRCQINVGQHALGTRFTANPQMGFSVGTSLLLVMSGFSSIGCRACSSVTTPNQVKPRQNVRTWGCPFSPRCLQAPGGTRIGSDPLQLSRAMLCGRQRLPSPFRLHDPCRSWKAEFGALRANVWGVCAVRGGAFSALGMYLPCLWRGAYR